MQHPSLLGSSLALAVIAAIAGCGPGDDRPPVEGDLAPDETPPLFASSPLEPIADAVVCEPGASRPCRLYIVHDGVLSCPLSAQLCRSDGRGWQRCGAPPNDAGPPPLPPPAEPDAQAAIVH